MNATSYEQLARPGVRKLQAYQPGKPIDELQREYGITDVVKLASNENPLGPGPKALAAMREGLHELARYPDGNGFHLKLALIDKHPFDIEQITLGNGSNDVLELIARAFAGPGDEIIFSQHAFAIYPIVTQVVGARAVVSAASDWGHDLEVMAKAVSHKTKLVFLANPNNPTGTYFSKQSLETFLSSIPANVIVVLDEAYFEYASHPAMQAADYPDGLTLLSEYDNLVVTRTFSKAYGLAGLRVGYAVSNPQIADILNRVRQPFNVNGMALCAATAALDDRAHLEKSVKLNAKGMEQYQAAFGQMGLVFIPSRGNFVSVNVGDDAPAVYDALLREGVIVRPVENYAMPGFLRVSVGLPEENQRAIDALQHIINR